MSNSNVQLAISAQLMQNYVAEAPVANDTQVAVVCDGQGMLQIYSIGTDGGVYNLRPAPESPTGWRVANLNFLGQCSAIQAVVDGSGVTWAIALDTANSLYVITDSLFGQWVSLGGSTGFPIPLLCASVASTGVLEACVVAHPVGTDPYQAGGLYQINVYQPDLGFSRITAAGDFYGTPGLGYGMWTLPGQDQPVDGLFYTSLGIEFVAGSQAVSVTGAPGFGISTFCVVTPTGASSTLFILSQQGQVYVFGQGNSITSINPSNPPTTFNVIEAQLDASGLFELWLVGADRTLYLLRQSSSGDLSSWDTLVPITTGIAHMTTTLDADGNVHVFAVQATGDLLHIWQDPDTTDWNVVPVEVESLGLMSEVACYDTSITVYDTNNVAQPGLTVVISCDSPVSVQINGETALLDSGFPWNGPTDALGRVRVTAETTNLGMNSFLVWAAGMPDGDSILVDPSGQIQDTLYTVQSGNLLAAQVTADDGSQTPLLQGNVNRSETVVDALAQFLNQAASMGYTPPDNTPEGRRFLHPRTDGRIARPWSRATGGDPSRIDLSRVPEQHWRLTFVGKRLSFQHLDPSEATSLIAARRASSSGPSASILDYLGEFGDVVEGIFDGAEELEETASTIGSIIVSTIVGPDGLVSDIQCLILFAEQAVQYAWDGAIEFVEEAFDLIVMVFQAIEVAFEDLFRWLGIIFNWPNIMRTSEAIQYSFGQILPFLSDALGDVNSSVDSELNTLKSEIPGYFQTAISLVQNTTWSDILDSINSSARAKAADSDTSLSDLLATVEHDVVGSFLTSSILDAGPSITFPDLSSVVSTLMTDLENAFSDPEVMTAFQAAVTYFTSAFSDDPSNFVTDLVSSYLSAMEGISVLVLDLLEAIIDAIFAAAQTIIGWFPQLLDQSIDLPVVSEFLNLIGADDTKVTVGDIFILPLAVVSNAIFAVALDQAPFPDDESLQQFESALTTDSLLQASGISGSAAAGMQGERAGSLPPEVAIPYIVGSAAQWLYGGFDAYVDFNDMKVAKRSMYPSLHAGRGGAASLLPNLGVFVIEVCAQTLTCPWFVGTGGVGVGSEEDFANLNWILQFLPAIQDGASLIYTAKQQGQPMLARQFQISTPSPGVGTALGGLIVGHTGVFELAFTIARSAKYGVVDVTMFEDLVTSLTYVGKYLRLVPPAEGPLYELCMTGLALVDGLGALAVGAMEIYDGIEALSGNNAAENLQRRSEA